MNKNLMLVLILVLGCFALLPAVAEAQTLMDAEFRITWVGVLERDVEVTVQFYDGGNPLSAEIDLDPDINFEVWTTVAPFFDNMNTATHILFRWNMGGDTWDIASPFQVNVGLGQGLVEADAEVSP